MLHATYNLIRSIEKKDSIGCKNTGSGAPTTLDIGLVLFISTS